jgi:MFS family permease
MAATMDAGAVRGRTALEALNFFMADMQAGIGPFLGVFLLAHGWQSGMIGTVMTMGGVAGVAMTTPAGAWVDASTSKRMLVIVPGVATVLASVIVLVSQRFWLVGASQVATAIAGAAIGPAVAGITLGMVRQTGFSEQMGRNQAFNHAGNAVGAALSGVLGWKLGLPAVFCLAAVFGVLSIGSVLLIPRSTIDDGAARGLSGKDGDAGKASGASVLFESKPLLVIAGALALFHLGNAAMLPLFGMAVAARKEGDPAATVALTIVVAQSVMIAASLVAMKMAARGGAWLILLVSFVALPVRGLVAAHLLTRWGVYPVQMLDGVGAGLQSVAVPTLVARVLDGTGRINVGQGAVMTLQGIGASLSPALGGWIAQLAGYPVAFEVLGAFAVGSIVLWVACAPLLRASCGPPRDAGVNEPSGEGSHYEAVCRGPVSDVEPARSKLSRR